MTGYNPYAAGPTGYNNGAGMQQMDPSVNGNNMMIGPENGMGSAGGQSIDDIVNNNNNANMMRRPTMPHHYSSNQGPMDADLNGLAMLEFTGNSPSGPLDHFSFDPSTNLAGNDVMNPSASMSLSDRSLNTSRRQSAGDLSLNTTFANNNASYAPGLSHATSYQSVGTQGGQNLDLDMNSPFISTPMGMNMDYSNSPSLSGIMPVDQNAMAMYNQTPYHPSMMSSPMAASPIHHTSMSGTMRSISQDQGSGDANSSSRPSQSRSQSMHTPNVASQQLQRPPLAQQRSAQHQQQRHHQQQLEQEQQQQHRQHQQQQQQQQSQAPQQPQQPQQTQQQLQKRPSSAAAPQRQHSVPEFSPQPPKNQAVSREEIESERNRLSAARNSKQNNVLPESLGWKTPDGGWPSTLSGRPHMQSQYKNAYSSTGFDMLGVLIRVATRPNPEINIGSVDLSCAFVVCDAEKDDCPIVYCSDNFERLTGYTRHMILGRNCRFLQSPDGHVESGIKRKYVDDNSVLYLKNMVNTQKEAQISLINYRRGGQPFMNLLTIIPITWDTDEVKFFVGFQVDLVEQPNAVTDRNPDGSYSINYQRGLTMPRYVMNAPESLQNKAELGQTIPRDDVSAILSTIGNGESDYAKRMWDKVLLENTDDVVHVLSLKGLFQWVSPSSIKVLEYEPGELIGTALSSVCHPSDIVPVTRELKDTSTGASVNVVFRIRRKISGYMWFEGHGSLHTEQGKGRKSIILVGRERPVYTLSKAEIAANNGIGENELWTKMSTSGMFLYVSSNVRQLLDRQPEELVGVSIQSLMRADSKNDFVSILEHARTGKKASVKHEMINRRGQVLQAFTTLYPGDATEGQKPTFIVAQTRLVKYPRGHASARPNATPKGDRGSESVHSTTGLPNLHAGEDGTTSSEPSQVSLSQYVPTEGAAVTYAGQNGLVLGHQDVSLASEDNLFDELKTTKSSSWQYEIRQLEKKNRMLAEEVQSLLAAKKKRKRRKGAGQMQKDCANCHTRVTPEWRRGPSGQRDLCNSCGLRWAKLNGRVSPRTTSQQSAMGSDKNSQASASPQHIVLASDSMPLKAEYGPGGHHMSRTSSSLAGHTGVAGSPRGHSANMEGASGVPEKIEEDVEPD
ncbi:hypothetical protein AAFC00_005936 [Neodothiora populina]|uniref:White collar 1 protein n=1 Tax=Neodothiora populina TaxID=2781224 RepID=A0ABR3P6P4_9PEZI